MQTAQATAAKCSCMINYFSWKLNLTQLDLTKLNSNTEHITRTEFNSISYTGFRQANSNIRTPTTATT